MKKIIRIMAATIFSNKKMQMFDVEIAKNKYVIFRLGRKLRLCTPIDGSMALSPTGLKTYGVLKALITDKIPAAAAAA